MPSPSRSRNRSTPSARSGNPARRAAQTRTAQVLHRTTPRFSDWVRGARPATLALSIAPIPVGYGAAVVSGEAHVTRTLLALAVSILLQLGVNFANDYSDGIRGTDEHRVGPQRLVGSGLVKPRTVLIVALVLFGLAAVAGLGIVVITQHWWLIGLGAVAIIAAWFYTGGKRPYGYNALGEVFVFVFFGLVAVLGTAYINDDRVIDWDYVQQEALFGAIAIGALAAAVLIANNIRDIPQDRIANKRTLSVLIGVWPSRILFVLLALVVPFGLALIAAMSYTVVWFTLFALLLVVPACVIVLFARTPGEYVTALKLTSVGTLVFGVALGAGYAITPALF